MYLEQTDLDIAIFANNLDEAIMAIGTSDLFKCSAICRLLKKLSLEPSEIVVLSTNPAHKSFYEKAEIPIASSLEEVVCVLRELIEELQRRQRLFRFRGEIEHQINIVIEVDDLHDALRERAIELNHEYSERELDGAIEMLREDGPGIGIAVIVSTNKPQKIWNHRLYSGVAAYKFVNDSTNGVSEEDVRAVRMQAHPCCFAIADDIYPMDNVSDRFVPLGIEQVAESERAIGL